MTTPLDARTSVLAAARLSRARLSTNPKSWIAGDSRVQEDAINDAREADISDTNEAQRIVQCTTRFATVMCVIIATIKVSVYMYTKTDVVKTSALDSMGDLMANAITLYTGVRMAAVDRKRYPVGQAKFESLGCLVFSTLMFAMMFGNALGNLEGVLETNDDVGQWAVNRLFLQAAPYSELKEVAEMSKEFTPKKNEKEGKGTWLDAGANSFDNPLIKYFKEKGDDNEKTMIKNEDDYPKKVNMKWVVEKVSEYENEARKAEELFFQNVFLGMCATYKFCLWLYCLLYAIPKSGSNVLVALAADKRNDFCVTGTMIAVTSLAFKLGDTLPFPEDKVDPGLSLTLSCVIMFMWGQLVMEHLVILSQNCADPEYCEGVVAAISSSMASPCSFHDDDVAIYVSAASKHTVEACLTVENPGAAFKDIAATCENVRTSIERLEDIERVIITTKVMGSGNQTV